MLPLKSLAVVSSQLSVSVSSAFRKEYLSTSKEVKEKAIISVLFSKTNYEFKIILLNSLYNRYNGTQNWIFTLALTPKAFY